MKRLIKFLPLVVVASLTACEKYKYVDNSESPLYVFGTFVTIKMQVDNKSSGDKCFKELQNILKQYDAYSDHNNKRDVTNVWSLNQTNEKLEINEDFYYLLARAVELQKSVTYFNPLIGSLSHKWKVALNLSNESDHLPYPLSDKEIEEELSKINSSAIVLEETEQGWYAQRQGEALIDLGAVAKGYALDKCYEYLNNNTNHSNDYLINAGRSSVLLGKNSQKYKVWKGRDYEEGVYIVKVTDIQNYENLRLFNSFVSTSGISEQNVTIDDQVYSHIINPITGSAISNYDKVVVINYKNEGNGALGDALSTSLMMSNEEEIKKAEKDFEVKIIATKGNDIVYKSQGVTLYF